MALLWQDRMDFDFTLKEIDMSLNAGKGIAMLRRSVTENYVKCNVDDAASDKDYVITFKGKSA